MVSTKHDANCDPATMSFKLNKSQYWTIWMCQWEVTSFLLTVHRPMVNMNHIFVQTVRTHNHRCFACGMQNENWDYPEPMGKDNAIPKPACKPPIYTYWLSGPLAAEDIEVKHNTKCVDIPVLANVALVRVEARPIPVVEPYE